MNAIQNFAFEEHLVRVVAKDGAEWFVGKDICGALDIQKHHQALDSLDPDERGTYTVGTPSGEQTMIVVSEPGVYRLVFRSRKPEAERFKRWLAHDVLPQIRRTGAFQQPAGALAPAEADPDHRQRHALALVTEARMTFGKAAAARLWAALGLPAPGEEAADTEPEACLAHLLGAPAHGGTVGELLSAAFIGVAEAADLLAGCGVRAGDGVFTVANAHPFIRKRFRATRWQRPYRWLRRLDGAAEAKVMKYGGLTSRGVELPAYYAAEE